MKGKEERIMTHNVTRLKFRHPSPIDLTIADAVAE